MDHISDIRKIYIFETSFVSTLSTVNLFMHEISIALTCLQADESKIIVLLFAVFIYETF